MKARRKKTIRRKEREMTIQGTREDRENEKVREKAPLSGCSMQINY